MNILILTENDEFGLKVGNHIKNASEAPSKVMTISPNFATTKLSTILSDPYWEDTQPERIHILFFQHYIMLYVKVEKSRYHVHFCCKRKHFYQ